MSALRAPLVIPLRSGEAAEVDALPEDPSDLVALLQDEMPPVVVWARVAGAYQSMGLSEAADRVLRAATDPRVLNDPRLVAANPSEHSHACVQVLAARASLIASQAVQHALRPRPQAGAEGVSDEAAQAAAASAHKETQELFTRAEDKLGCGHGQGADADLGASALAVVKALQQQVQFVLGLRTAPAQGQSQAQTDAQQARLRQMRTFFAAARKAYQREVGGTSGFRRVEDSGVDVEGFHVTAALGEAVALFHMDDFGGARKLFARAIRAAPDQCPAAARVALGYCLFRLGHASAAKAAMTRALQIDPRCTDALVAHAALSMLEAEQAARASSSSSSVSAAGATAAIEEARQGAVVLLEHALGTSGDSSKAPSAPLLLTLARAAFWTWVPVVEREGGEPVTATALPQRRVVHLSHAVAQRFRSGELLRLGGGRSSGPEATSSGILITPDPRGAVAPAGWPGTEGRAPGTVLRTLHPIGGDEALERVTVFRRDFRRSADLARRAAEITTSTSLRAEALYVAGRALHAAGEYLDAWVSYRKAAELRPDMTPALIGKAQMLLSQGRAPDARALLERDVLTRHPDDPDALKLLTAILRSEKKVTRATELAKRATEVAPGDPDAWLALAELLQLQRQPHHLKAAFAAYRKAGALLTATRQAPPLELFANMAALTHSVGDLPTAERFYRRSLRMAALEERPDARDEAEIDAAAARAIFNPRCCTIAYNLTRLREEQGKTEEAARIYRSLSERFPGYVDFLVRLGSITEARGDASEARAWYSRAIEAAQGRPLGEDAIALLAHWHADRGDLAGARDHLDSVIRNRMRTRQGPGHVEQYAALEKANMYFAEIYSIRASADKAIAAATAAAAATGAIAAPAASTIAAIRDKAAQKTDEALKRAFRTYKDILKVTPGNVYAANGLGQILAMQGRVREARDVFAAAREAAQDAAPVTLSLAHCQLALDAPEAAFHLYRYTLDNFFAGTDGSLEVLLYMARARVAQEKYSEAIGLLRKALRIRPDSVRLWFNLAFVLGEECFRILQRSAENRNLQETERAERYLVTSVRYFKWVQTTLAARAATEQHTGSSLGSRPTAGDHDADLSDGEATAASTAASSQASEARDSIASNISAGHGFATDLTHTKLASVRSAFPGWSKGGLRSTTPDDEGVSADVVARLIAHAERQVTVARQHVRYQKQRDTKRQRELAERAARAEEARQQRDAARIAEEQAKEEERQRAQTAARELQARLAEDQARWAQEQADRERQAKLRKEMAKAKARRGDLLGDEEDDEDAGDAGADAGAAATSSRAGAAGRKRASAGAGRTAASAPIARLRRIGDEDDAIDHVVEEAAELHAVFGCSAEDLLTSIDDIVNSGAGSAPLAVDDVFAGVGPLPHVADDAVVGGGSAAAVGDAAMGVAADLGDFAAMGAEAEADLEAAFHDDDDDDDDVEAGDQAAAHDDDDGEYVGDSAAGEASHRRMPRKRLRRSAADASNESDESDHDAEGDGAPTSDPIEAAEPEDGATTGSAKRSRVVVEEDDD